jgi:hypothetical protein
MLPEDRHMGGPRPAFDALTRKTAFKRMSEAQSTMKKAWNMTEILSIGTQDS